MTRVMITISGKSFQKKISVIHRQVMTELRKRLLQLKPKLTLDTPTSNTQFQIN